MGASTGISWTDATFNPWWGCAKVSPACDRCYAENQAARFGTAWGVDAERRTFGDKHWDAPRHWNRRAEREGRTIRVFCASMADVFDKNAPAGARERLWALIRETPHLTWQVLTKRIGNAKRMLPADWGEGYANVQLGSTIATRDEADRDVIKLIETPARTRFLSMEPLLEGIDLTDLCDGIAWREVPEEHWVPGFDTEDSPPALRLDALRGLKLQRFGDYEERCARVDWVIVGGESGRGARAMDPQWARDLRDQCEDASVPFFFKQLGGEINKRGELDDIPEDLHVRQFPEHRVQRWMGECA
jgi:protein gp37